MRDVFLIYDGCCFYEIVTLCYFMRYAGCDLVFCAPEKKPVRAMEGFTVQPDLSLEELDCRQVRSLIVPGGRVLAINRPEIHDLLRTVRDQQGLIAGICAGVDVLDDAGILRGIRSTHSADEDLVCADNSPSKLPRCWACLPAGRTWRKPSPSGRTGRGCNR